MPKSRIFKIYFKTAALAVMALLVSFCLFGCGEGAPQIADDGYEYTGVKITASVNADCTVDIVEELSVRFIEPSHGIMRTLPTNSGERYRKVTTEGDKCRFSHENGFLVLLFGEEERIYGSGHTVNYKISYRVELPEVENDRLLYNLIGADFDTTIADVDLTVKFPAPLDTDPSVYVGSVGSTDTSRATVTVSSDKKTVTVSLKKSGDFVLAPFEAVTMDAKLPDGTFEKPFDFTALATWGIGLALVVIVLLVKIFAAREDKPVATVSFYPPADENGRQLSPADVGTVIDNSCSPEDVVSYLFFWASKGCLEIEEIGDDTKLIFKGELDDRAPSYERWLFEQLSARAKEDEENGERYVMVSSLENSFYSKISTTQSALNSRYKSKLYSGRHAALAFLMTAIASLFAAITVFLAYFTVAPGWFNFFPLLVFVPAFLVLVFGQFINMNRYKFSKSARIGALAAYILSAAAICTVCLLLLPYNVMNMATRLGVAVPAAAIALIAPFMNKRTKYYNDKLGEIIGFKDFLRLAEKDKLEAMLADNPQYYYDILPYANVLGVSKIWEDKFASLTVEPPSYYRMDAGDVFTILMFNRMYNRMRSRCRTTMVSRPQASSGGHSGGGFSRGGGGFSGGGFGGGGSRRW